MVNLLSLCQIRIRRRDVNHLRIWTNSASLLRALLSLQVPYQIPWRIGPRTWCLLDRCSQFTSLFCRTQNHWIFCTKIQSTKWTLMKTPTNLKKVKWRNLCLKTHFPSIHIQAKSHCYKPSHWRFGIVWKCCKAKNYDLFCSNTLWWWWYIIAVVLNPSCENQMHF